jgi:GTP pyrophosphokinase
MVYVETQFPSASEHHSISEWLAENIQNRPQEEVELIQSACRLAETAHVKKLRPSGEPYLEHAISVASVLNSLKLDHEAIAAAILLEVIDETDLTLEDIASQCSQTVAKLVDEVIRMNEIGSFYNESNHTNKEPMKAESLRKLLLAMAEDVRVVLIKLADRLQEMRHLKNIPDDEKRRIARETMDIYAPLANRLGIWQIKWELEDLSFRYLDPGRYRQIAVFLDERRVDRQEYIQSIIMMLKDKLAEIGVTADIKGRAKHIYSIWKKMKRKGIGFDELYDVRAVRVLTDSTADCYHVLGVVHGLWPHIPKEFDDYIATPKENDYQSIHTAVIGPGGKTVEIQIRTYEMEKHAELGVAAHWRYKEGGKQDQRFEQRIAWLRQLLDWREDEGSDHDFIDQFKSEIFQDRVYVMTPSGEVFDLPYGSTPLDFAYYIHSEVGNRCRGAKVNGRIVPLVYTLQSGEHVEILTAKQGKPSRDWLNPQLGYLTTSRARNKARNWFKQLDYDQNLHDGRTILDRELNRLGVRDLQFEKLAGFFKQPSVDEMLVAIGRSEISSAHIASATQRLNPVKPLTNMQPHRSRTHKSDTTNKDTISVEGVGNLMYQLAKCCRPAAGDPIIGFITVGRGISVHRQDCKNILNLAEEKRMRLVEVAWGGDEKSTYPVDVIIEAFDRKGLLMDLYGLLSTENVNVIASNTVTDRHTHRATVRVTLEILNIDQLSRILNRINQLPNILDVKRSG